MKIFNTHRIIYLIHVVSNDVIALPKWWKVAILNC